MTTEQYISAQGYLGAFGLMLPIEVKVVVVCFSFETKFRNNASGRF